MTTNRRILLVEDEDFVRASLVELLEEEGYEVVPTVSVDAAEEALASGGVDLVLTDLRMPGRDGLELLRALEGRGVPTILISGHGTLEEAVAAMKAGAYDFIQKPVEPDQLVAVVQRALHHASLLGEVRRLRETVQRLDPRGRLVGRSPALERVRELVRQVAPTDTPVLLQGESGTGKELVARELHEASPRSRGPFVLVNCATIADGTFEAEFFGAERGAPGAGGEPRLGRFAEAAGGTLVLDDVESLKPDAQALFLRVLEDGTYCRVGDARQRHLDARVVAVTNEDLAPRVEAGTFRGDLYYRLAVFPIELPPLRTHLEDVAEISAELFERVRARVGGPAPARPLDEAALAVLRSYAWPGNVRELRNVLERATILAGGPDGIDAQLLGRVLTGTPRHDSTPRTLVIKERLEALERELVLTALVRTEGNRKEASKLLGIDPKNFSYYVRKHDLGGEV